MRRYILKFSPIVLLAVASCQGQKRLSDSYQLILEQEPATLHPLNAEDTYASTINSYILESLLDRNLDTYDWDAALANKWEITKDGKSFTFEIRPDAVWSDGKPVTAEDVKFSFDAIFDDRFQTAHIRPYYEGLKDVQVVNDHKVTFHAKETYFGNFESAATLTILPKHVYGDPKADQTRFNREVLGSGPYILKKFEQGKSLTLEKNPQWWGIKDPEKKDVFTIKKIRFKFVGDGTVSVEMVKKGEADFVALSADDYMSKTKGDGWGSKWMKVQTQNKAPRGFGFLAFNLRSKLFSDVRVRKALAHLFNRDLMIDKFLYGLSEKATGPWHKASEYASPKVEAIPYDTNQANALLKAAGWKDADNNGILENTIDGKKTDFKFTLYLPSPDSEKYFTVFKEDLKKAGIDMSIQIMEWSAFLKIMDEGNFDALTLGWGAGSVDLDPKQIWHSSSAGKGGSNFIHYKNPEVDRLIDQARVTMDKEKRIPILQKVYELIAADVPYIFMFNSKYSFYIHTSRVKKKQDTYNYGIGQRYWKLDEPVN
jgi:microcin C transport system substrate-binding protein